MRKAAIAVGVIALAGFLYWLNLWQAERVAGATVTVKTIRVEPQELVDKVLAPAVLDVWREVEVRNRVNGPALTLLVQVGDPVQSGQVLARVDPSDLTAALRQAESNVAQARSTEIRLQRDAALAPEQVQARLRAAAIALDQAEAGLTAVRTSLRNQEPSTRLRLAQARAGYDGVRARAANLQATPEELAAALQQVQAAEADLAALDPATSAQVREAELRVAAARQGLEQARVETQAAQILPEQMAAATAARLAAENTLADARDRLDQAEIRSPIAGVALQVPARAGQPAQPGLVVAVIAESDRLVAKVRVDEMDIAKVRPGLAVVITTPAFPGASFSGKVVRIEPRGTRQAQGAATVYEVEVEVDNRSQQLRAGMNVDTETVATTRPGALAVPMEAVQEAGDRRYLWVVAAGRARQQAVTQGLSTAGDVEVTAGLAAGTEVIVGPATVLTTLKEGQPVKAAPATAAGGS